MRKLLSVVLLGAIVSCANIPTIQEKIKLQDKINYASIPEEYKEYKDKPVIGAGWLKFSDGEFSAYKEYDVNYDGVSDVIEIFSMDKGSIAYGFDLDQNGNFDCYEILIDGKRDGLNGNETQLSIDCKQ